jgi:hypothetical protein
MLALRIFLAITVKKHCLSSNFTCIELAESSEAQRDQNAINPLDSGGTYIWSCDVEEGHQMKRASRPAIVHTPGGCFLTGHRQRGI